MGLIQRPQGYETPRSMDLISAAIYTASTMSTPATSAQSLKRSLDLIDTPPNSLDQSPSSASKRQRCTNSKSDGPISTPPISPRVQSQPLQITIPDAEPTKAEQKTLKLRRRYAERWRPKLQKPYPTKTEIKQAYQYKLMRHYIEPLAVPESNFVKPHIDRSPRVDKLRKDFPVLNTSSLGKVTTTENKAEPQPSPSPAEVQLEHNRAITKSKAARRSAWRNFSSREKDRIDRGREAMLASGLPQEELNREYEGKPNNLPGWRKKHTSVFAKRAKGDSKGAETID